MNYGSGGLVVSKANSTSSALGANQEFIGATDDVSAFMSLDINVIGTPTDAGGTLYFEFSPDGSATLRDRACSEHTGEFYFGDVLLPERRSVKRAPGANREPSRGASKL